MNIKSILRSLFLAVSILGFSSQSFAITGYKLQNVTIKEILLGQYGDAWIWTSTNIADGQGCTQLMLKMDKPNSQNMFQLLMTIHATGDRLKEISWDSGMASSNGGVCAITGIWTYIVSDE